MKIFSLKNPCHKLLLSSWLSLVGDLVTTIALTTFVYELTHSPKKVASIFIYKTLATFFSGFLTPLIIDRIDSRQNLLISLDLARGFLILSLLFCKNLYFIYFVIFLETLLTGIYYPLKQACFQAITNTENRVNYLSLDQSMSNLLNFIIPALAGFAFIIFKLPIFFVIDAISFLLSAILIRKLPKWHQKYPRDRSSLLRKIFSGYAIIAKVDAHRHLLFFRLLLLFSLSCYEVIKLLYLTNIGNHINHYSLPDHTSFAILIGSFTSISALFMCLTSLFIMKFKKESHVKINLSLKYGVILLFVGILSLLIPLSNQHCWLFYMAGTCVFSIGLTLARIGVHATGNALTQKDVFIEVVSAADAVARLWQSLIYTTVVAISVIAPLPLLIMLSECSILYCLRFAKKLSCKQPNIDA